MHTTEYPRCVNPLESAAQFNENRQTVSIG